MGVAERSRGWGVSPADSNLKHTLSRPNLFPRRADVSAAGRPAANERAASRPPAAMEPAATSIQVLLQAAEFLERRERGTAGSRYPAEAEHGYASRSRRAAGSVR